VLSHPQEDGGTLLKVATCDTSASFSPILAEQLFGLG
jgi:hypothetical protein